MSIGERAIIRTADAVSGVEYALPCTLAWVHDGAPLHHGARRRRHSGAVGLSGARAGRPSRDDLRVLSIGRQARLVT